jgi:hypothetical protein
MISFESEGTCLAMSCGRFHPILAACFENVNKRVRVEMVLVNEELVG